MYLQEIKLWSNKLPASEHQRMRLGNVCTPLEYLHLCIRLRTQLTHTKKKKLTQPFEKCIFMHRVLYSVLALYIYISALKLGRGGRALLHGSRRHLYLLQV